MGYRPSIFRGRTDHRSESRRCRFARLLGDGVEIRLSAVDDFARTMSDKRELMVSMARCCSTDLRAKPCLLIIWLVWFSDNSLPKLERKSRNIPPSTGALDAGADVERIRPGSCQRG